MRRPGPLTICAVFAVSSLPSSWVGNTAGVGEVEARTGRSSKPAAKGQKRKASARKSTARKTSAKAGARAGKGKRRETAAQRKRRIAREDYKNIRRAKLSMPSGWAWPPNTAMKAQGKACTEQLDALGIGWKPAKPDGHIVTPITLDSLEIGGIELHSRFRPGPHVMDCHFALGMANLAPILSEAGVRKVTFSSIFRETRVRAHGRTGNQLSRHGLGLAIDIYSMTDEDGREVVVKADYPKGDEFLLSVETQLIESGLVRSLLTPRNDPRSHDDHYHFEFKIDAPAPAPRKPNS